MRSARNRQTTPILFGIITGDIFVGLSFLASQIPRFKPIDDFELISAQTPNHVILRLRTVCWISPSLSIWAAKCLLTLTHAKATDVFFGFFFGSV